MESATSPPSPTHDGDELLLEFVSERDAHCPLCGYNVRNLSMPRCPECDKKLQLTVGIADIRIGWFVAALAPCIFSGLCAVFLTAIFVSVGASGGGSPPWFVQATVAFGWMSGITGIALLKYRRRFLILSDTIQRRVGLLMWLIHVLAFLGLLAMAFRPFI